MSNLPTMMSKLPKMISKLPTRMPKYNGEHLYSAFSTKLKALWHSLFDISMAAFNIRWRLQATWCQEYRRWCFLFDNRISVCRYSELLCHSWQIPDIFLSYSWHIPDHRLFSCCRGFLRTITPWWHHCWMCSLQDVIDKTCISI